MSSGEREKWLASLKVGDEFVRSERYGGLGEIHKITRETNTRFYFMVNSSYEAWFHKKDGYEPSTGSGFYSPRRANPITEKYREEIIRNTLITKIGASSHTQRYRELSTEKLRELLTILGAA